jgi:hypothetical protein
MAYEAQREARASFPLYSVLSHTYEGGVSGHNKETRNKKGNTKYRKGKRDWKKKERRTGVTTDIKIKE